MIAQENESLLVIKQRPVSKPGQLWDCVHVPNGNADPARSSLKEGNGWLNGNVQFPVTWRSERSSIATVLQSPEEMFALGVGRDLIEIEGYVAQASMPFFILPKSHITPQIFEVELTLNDEFSFSSMYNNAHIWSGGLGEAFFDGLWTIDREMVAKSKERSISVGDWVIVGIGDDLETNGVLHISKLMPGRRIRSQLFLPSNQRRVTSGVTVTALDWGQIGNAVSATFRTQIGHISLM